MIAWDDLTFKKKKRCIFELLYFFQIKKNYHKITNERFKKKKASNINTELTKY